MPGAASRAAPSPVRLADEFIVEIVDDILLPLVRRLSPPARAG